MSTNCCQISRHLPTVCYEKNGGRHLDNVFIKIIIKKKTIQTIIENPDQFNCYLLVRQF